MMPPWIASPLEVIEAQLAFEVFVDPLGSPTLFDMADQLLRGCLFADCSEINLTGLALTLFPLHQ